MSEVSLENALLPKDDCVKDGGKKLFIDVYCVRITNP